MPQRQPSIHQCVHHGALAPRLSHQVKRSPGQRCTHGHSSHQLCGQGLALHNSELLPESQGQRGWVVLWPLIFTSASRLPGLWLILRAHLRKPGLSTAPPLGSRVLWTQHRMTLGGHIGSKANLAPCVSVSSAKNICNNHRKSRRHKGVRRGEGRGAGHVGKGNQRLILSPPPSLAAPRFLQRSPGLRYV